MSDIKKTVSENILLNGFNSRDETFFAHIYSLLFNDLCNYANHIFEHTEVEGCDIIHDIFISIWSKNDLVFNGIINIKAYAYTSVKNRYKNYVTKNMHSKRYNEAILSEEDAYVTSIVENEITSLVAIMSDFLSEDCAKIFKLYLEGWDIKDISEELNIPKSSVYAKKKIIANILKKKFKLLYVAL